jgi:two-component system NtrC family sensor kinase
MPKKIQPGQTQKKQRGIGPVSLQRKFLMGVGFIFLFFCFVFAFLIYFHEKRLLEDAAHAKSRMVMAAVKATRGYVREELRPKMYEVLGKDDFVLEAMSTSYVGRSVMERFKKTLPEYQYRRVALHARNPVSEPQPFENQMIVFFSEHPQQKDWQGMIKIAGRSHFVYANPVYFTESCMHCHGDPDDAPQALLSIYGRERGFGQKPGQIAGVNAVNIPVDIALAKIKERAYSVFGVSVLCLTLLYVLICFFFNRVVVHNLRYILEIFREGLRNDEEVQLLKEAEDKDEIGELTTAAKVMASHLRNARQQLEGYAQNLEVMVTERTKALRESQQQLRDKVTARNRELQGLNTIAELITRAVNLVDILPKVLQQTLNLIPARGAALYLLRDNPSCLELQCQENAERLPDRIPFDAGSCKHILDGEPADLETSLCEAACGQTSFIALQQEQQCLNVPLCCRDKVLGVMAFVGVDFDEIPVEMHQLLFCIGNQIGITIESLRSMEDLLQSKELLQSVFDGITDMLVLLDRELRIKMVNRAHLKQFGVTLEDTLNKQCCDPQTCHSCPFIQCNIEAAFKSKTPFTEEVQSSDGKVFLVHYDPIVNEKGEVGSIVRTAKDITEEKRVEQKIQQTEKLVSLGQLAAGIAHEINNPLGVICCYADLLKHQLPDSPQGLSDVAIIEKHALNCQRIVSDLLKFARGQETEKKLIPLNPTIEDVVQMVASQFQQQHCEIELDLAPHMPMVNIDLGKLKQVYLNILMNARQAIKGRGKIRISTRYIEKDRQVKIVFWDSGDGISPKIKDRIFDPFFSTKETGKGTGLGLSVSYGIIKDHGGDIQVESKPDYWTRFMILLPVNEDESR